MNCWVGLSVGKGVLLLGAPNSGFDPQMRPAAITKLGAPNSDQIADKPFTGEVP